MSIILETELPILPGNFYSDRLKKVSENGLIFHRPFALADHVINFQ